MALHRWLHPTHVFDRVHDVQPDWLAAHGLRALLLDADNTLVPRHAYHLDDETRAWIELLLSHQLRLAILSNSASPRQVAKMVADYDIPTLALARKPARSGFRRALQRLDVTPAETAMVGDQLFTDILGGNRMGLRTILVPPCSTNDFIVYRLFGRTLERPLLRRRLSEPRG